MQEPGPHSVYVSAAYVSAAYVSALTNFFRQKALFWAIASTLFVPPPLLAQTQMTSVLSTSDLVSILLVLGLGITIWQWQLQRRDLKDARRLLYRLFEIQTQNTPHQAPTGATEPSSVPPSSPDSSPPGAIPTFTPAPSPELNDRLEQYAARVVQLHRVLEQALERLQGLQQAQETTNARLLEVHSLLPEGANVSKIMQRFQKDTAAGFERLQVTQAGLVSALDALNTTERRDNTLLETLGAELATQLGEIQADLGLVLKARPVRFAGKAQSPYDIALAAEYYTNLQKLIRGMIKNDKASTYALEGVQFLFESLQVQSSLTTLLSNSEFAIRLTPRVLDENIVQPILTQLKEGAQVSAPQREMRKHPSQNTSGLHSTLQTGLHSSLHTTEKSLHTTEKHEIGSSVPLKALDGGGSHETDLELPPFLLSEQTFAGASCPSPP